MGIFNQIEYMIERWLRRGQSQIHRNTLGKVNDKVRRGINELERKMNHMQDKVLDPEKAKRTEESERKRLEEERRRVDPPKDEFGDTSRDI